MCSCAARIRVGFIRDAWYHPWAGTFLRVPLAHILFREEALIRWRSNFKTDGATGLARCGWLDQMTIRRFERLVRRVVRVCRAGDHPCQKTAVLHSVLTREFTTAMCLPSGQTLSSRRRRFGRRRRKAGLANKRATLSSWKP